MLEFGESTVITQVAEPSTLPPPAPVEVLDQYSQLPMLPWASQDPQALHAAFHEASSTGIRPLLLPFVQQAQLAPVAAMCLS